MTDDKLITGLFDDVVGVGWFSDLRREGCSFSCGMFAIRLELAELAQCAEDILGPDDLPLVVSLGALPWPIPSAFPLP